MRAWETVCVSVIPKNNGGLPFSVADAYFPFARTYYGQIYRKEVRV